jgi:hypothetical protein
MRKWLVSCVLIVPFCATAQTHTNKVSLPQHLESLLDQRFQASRCPGLSVAVSLHNQIVFSKVLNKTRP